MLFINQTILLTVRVYYANVNIMSEKSTEQESRRERLSLRKKVGAGVAAVVLAAAATFGGIEYSKYVDREVAELSADLKTEGANLRLGGEKVLVPEIDTPNSHDGIDVVARGSGRGINRETYATPGKPAVIELPPDFTDHGSDRIGVVGGKIPLFVTLHDAKPGPPVQSWVLQKNVDPSRQADIAVHVGLSESVPDLSASIRYDEENNLVVDFALAQPRDTTGVEAFVLVGK